MARLALEGVPQEVEAGSPVGGTLVFDSSRPVKMRKFVLRMRGVERTSATVSSGFGKYRTSTTYTQEKAFFTTLAPLEGKVRLTPADEIEPGKQRIPFRFILPPDASPSMKAGDKSNGAEIFYEIEARVDVPWWPDPVDKSRVLVHAPGRALGTAPKPVFGSRSWAGRSKAELRLRFKEGPVVLDGKISGEYEITNPERKRVRKLTLTPFRRVSWTTKGYSRSTDGPRFPSLIEVKSNDPTITGGFELHVPPGPQSTVTWTGDIILVRWLILAKLDVAWDFDAEFEIKLGSAPRTAAPVPPAKHD